ncbi:hypothetical protein [Staphylococcus americanisciuri]|uniref:Uncharacterized protein n=1 Tax=Staphylococcus americanisciuri TaxID=2973940 RepID=A0ABT2F2J7_9STAP|nr:hypothetical protein [Staphylococcus americanisciuri]MCS4486057.1 hypothetical protein [Staphylococcus americanisciuri]
MVNVLQRYFITLVLLFMMLVLAFGFLAQYQNGGQLLLAMTLSVTAFSVALETWLAQSHLSSSKVRFIQTLAFPSAIIIIGMVCFILLPTV